MELSLLPRDLHRHVLLQLPGETIIRLVRRINRYWNQLSKEPYLWKLLCAFLKIDEQYGYFSGFEAELKTVNSPSNPWEWMYYARRTPVKTEGHSIGYIEIPDSTYQKNIFYFGHFQDAAAVGLGIAEAPTYRTVGHYKKGRMNGVVMMTITPGGHRYNGGMENDKFQGEGTYVVSDDNIREGSFVNNAFVYGAWTIGRSHYIGYFGISSRWNTIVSPDNYSHLSIINGEDNLAEGNFNIAIVHNGTYGIGWNTVWRAYYGRHRIVFEDGASYNGEFFNHLRRGYGCSLDPEGKVVYQGQWENDRPVEGRCDHWDGVFLSL